MDFETRSIFVRVFFEGRLGLVSGMLPGVGGGGLAPRYGCWVGLDEGVGVLVPVLCHEFRQCHCLWRCFPWKNCHWGKDRWKGLSLGSGPWLGGFAVLSVPPVARWDSAPRRCCAVVRHVVLERAVVDAVVSIVLRGWPLGKQIAVPNTFGGVSPVLLLECIPMKK